RDLCVPCLKPQNYELRAPRTSLRDWLRLRPPTHRRGRRILRRYDDDMRRALAQPDAVVVPTAFHREMYRGYRVDPGKAHVVPYGLPAAGYARDGRRRGMPLRVGYLGTLIPSKGAHLAVEAYGVLADPTGVTLDVHGSHVPFHGDAGYLDRLRA